MTPSPLLKYFDRWFGEFAKNFRLAAERLDQEGIHDYRVALKRLKALFRLVEALSPDFSAERQFRRLRRAFKISAGLRDIQIQLGIADELAAIEDFPAGAYRTFLLIPETKESTRFLRFAVDFQIDRFRMKRAVLADTLDGFDATALARSATERLALLMDELTARAEHPEADGGYHRFRIRAKETHYVREMHDLLCGTEADDDSFLKDIKKVHQALGAWHDREVARLWLARFSRHTAANVAPAIAVSDAAQARSAENFRQAWAVFREKHQ